MERKIQRKIEEITSHKKEKVNFCESFSFYRGGSYEAREGTVLG